METCRRPCRHSTPAAASTSTAPSRRSRQRRCLFLSLTLEPEAVQVRPLVVEPRVGKALRHRGAGQQVGDDLKVVGKAQQRLVV